MSKEQRTVKPSSSSSYSGSSSSLVSNGPTGASFSASNNARGSCLGVRFVATHYWTPKWKKFIPFFPSVRCPVPCFPAKSDHISSRGSSSKGPKSAQELTFLVALWPVTPQPDPTYRPDASALLGYLACVVTMGFVFLCTLHFPCSYLQFCHGACSFIVAQ